MKSLYLKLIPIFLLISLSSHASNPYFVIYDTDGMGRVTTYEKSPVTSMATLSTSARQFSLYIFRKDFSTTCNYANVYDEATGIQLAGGDVVLAGANSSTLTSHIEFSADILQKNKVIRVSCHSDNGDFFGVEHKVPGAPRIDWTSDLQSKGAWISAVQNGVGRFESLRYAASIHVNNHTQEGSCITSEQRGYLLGLFHGQFERKNFHSDYFNIDTEINAYDPPVLVQKISCANSGGTTHVTQIWEIGSNGIHQLDNQVHIE